MFSVTARCLRMPGAGSSWTCTEPEVFARLCVVIETYPDHQITMPAPKDSALGLARLGPMPGLFDAQAAWRSHVEPLQTRRAVQRAVGLIAAMAAVQRLGVSPSLVHAGCATTSWIFDQLRMASQVWVRLNGDDLARLGCTRPIGRLLPRFAQVMAQAFVAGSALVKVRDREYRGLPGAARPSLGVAPATLTRRFDVTERGIMIMNISDQIEEQLLLAAAALVCSLFQRLQPVGFRHLHPSYRCWRR